MCKTKKNMIIKIVVLFLAAQLYNLLCVLISIYKEDPLGLEYFAVNAAYKGMLRVYTHLIFAVH